MSDENKNITIGGKIVSPMVNIGGQQVVQGDLHINSGKRQRSVHEKTLMDIFNILMKKPKEQRTTEENQIVNIIDGVL